MTDYQLLHKRIKAWIANKDVRSEAEALTIISQCLPLVERLMKLELLPFHHIDTVEQDLDHWEFVMSNARLMKNRTFGISRRWNTKTKRWEIEDILIKGEKDNP